MAHVLTDLSTAALVAAGEANYLEMARYMARSPHVELYDDSPPSQGGQPGVLPLTKGEPEGVKSPIIHE